MMQQADRQRLTHIYEYCVSIENAIGRFGNGFEAFDSDEDFQHALSFCLLQIGELGGGLSEEYRRETASRVQWGTHESHAEHGRPRLREDGPPDYLGDGNHGYSRLESILHGAVGPLRPSAP